VCAAWLSSACVGTVPDEPNAGDDGDDEADPPDAAPVAPDAAPVPDAAPEPAAYPSGPYGTRVGSVIENLAWMGYRDGDGNGDPFDEDAREVTLEEFFSGRDPDAKIILINSAAGWCGPCQEEAPILRGLHNEYDGRGVRILSAIFETTSGSPAGVSYARTWGTTFNLPFAMVADPSDLLGPYYVENAVPMNMFVDAETMEIVEVYHGFDSQYTRSIFDAYVD
jgi:thiol-disulfide isomerase/thioredoxin